jgi:hypothetical protein
MGTQPKTIAIDFDGVIHAYSKGWQNGEIYDQPLSQAFTCIGSLFDTGYSVFVFTTRNKHQVKRWIEQQIMISDYEHSGPGNDPYEWVATRYGYTCKIIPFWKKFWNQKGVLGITNRKLPAHCYVDDRALKFEGDWLKTFDEIISFKTYLNKK